jgi:PTS system mannose-specific IIA component
VAEELVASARTIVGEVEGLEAVSIDWNDDVDEATRRIEQARGRVDAGQGVLLLTDMFGGTPTNLALSLLEPGKLEIVTGVNLPMLIKFTYLREQRSLLETADAIAEEARQAVQVASRLLQGKGARPGGEKR